MQKMFTVSLYSILLFPNWEVPQNELILPLSLEGFLQSIRKQNKTKKHNQQLGQQIMLLFYGEIFLRIKNILPHWIH